jgi:hypothetical protein
MIKLVLTTPAEQQCMLKSLHAMPQVKLSSSTTSNTKEIPKADSYRVVVGPARL